MASATSSGGRWQSSNGIKWWNEGRVPEEALSGMHCAYSGSLRCLTPRGKPQAFGFPSQPRHPLWFQADCKADTPLTHSHVDFTPQHSPTLLLGRQCCDFSVGDLLLIFHLLHLGNKVFITNSWNAMQHCD